MLHQTYVTQTVRTANTTVLTLARTLRKNIDETPRGTWRTLHKGSLMSSEAQSNDRDWSRPKILGTCLLQQVNAGFKRIVFH